MKKWIGIVTLLAAFAAHAEESQFAYVYTTDLLPKGKMEVEQWMTWRHQRPQGEFNVYEGRTEFEYGLRDDLQLALYANYIHADVVRDDVSGATAPPENLADLSADPGDMLSSSRFLGFSAEAIYRLWSPYTDPIGVAAYIEPFYGKDLFELEGRLILQKNFLEDRLIVAVNGTWSQEYRWLPGDPSLPVGDGEAVDHWDRETDLNLGLAASYRFIANWSLGFELQNEREFSSFLISNEYRTNNGTYFGPSIHYGGPAFFVTATALEQLAWGDDFVEPQPGNIVDGRNYADDFERYRLRIKAGYYF